MDAFLIDALDTATHRDPPIDPRLWNGVELAQSRTGVENK